MRIGNRIYAPDLETAKLKLKNEKPEFIQALIADRAASAFSRLRTKFGVKPPTPMEIKALASLHAETRYEATDGVPQMPTLKSPWEAAAVYGQYKAFAVDDAPSRPLPKRTPSSDSQASSKKSVQWADLSSVPDQER